MTKYIAPLIPVTHDGSPATVVTGRVSVVPVIAPPVSATELAFWLATVPSVPPSVLPEGPAKGTCPVGTLVFELGDACASKSPAPNSKKDIRISQYPEMVGRRAA